MAVSNVSRTSSASQVKVVDPSKTGFNGLTSEDFLKLLITQLQNQDPSNPLDSDQLLNQISQMRSLQANLELESSLKSLTLGQQLSSAAGFIGKSVKAITGTNNQNVTGIVDSVQVKDGKAYLNVNGTDVLMSEVTDIAA